MKTIQEYLREADREKILRALSYDLLCNPMILLEVKDLTVGEIREAYKQKISQLIDYLLLLKAEPSDHMVFYLYDSRMDERGFCHTDHSLALVDTNEISKDLDASSYGIVITAWEESLGYLVADNKLTQDYLQELLAQYLKEITFFGLDPKKRSEKVEQVKQDLEQSCKEIENGQYYTFDEVNDQIWEEFGLPIDEKDEEQDRLRRKIQEAEYQYDQYCNRRERRRILESLGITSAEVEEAE